MRVLYAHMVMQGRISGPVAVRLTFGKLYSDQDLHVFMFWEMTGMDLFTYRK